MNPTKKLTGLKKALMAGVMSAATLVGVRAPARAGATPASGGIGAGGVLFSDLSGNLKLKNISTVNGTTSGPTTTSTTYAVVPGMTVTITTKGNKVLVAFTGSVSTTGTTALSGGVFAVFKDGTQLSNDFFIDTGSINSASVLALNYIDAPTAASHTYDIRWRNGSTSQTTEIQGTAYTLQVVELG